MDTTMLLEEVSQGFDHSSDKEEKVQDRLGRLGFKKAASKITELKDTKRKLAIAYEHYRYVTYGKMQAFKDKLRAESYKKNEWKELAFTPLESYEKTPPSHVLDNLEKAMNRKCFDSFSIAHIVKVKDPILFGFVKGCSDAFFIDQWDDDVKISDILKDNEG